MPSSAETDITSILAELPEAGQQAMARLMPLVYEELRAVAEAYLHRERPDHTLQTTALVNEAYLRLCRREDAAWNNRAHFYRAAAKTMRRVLINHAVQRRALKRGGGRRAVDLDAATLPAADQSTDLIALDEALRRLAEIDEQKAQVVELRFFAGCSIEDAAKALDISTATVERDWRFARAWLRTELSDEDHA